MVSLGPFAFDSRQVLRLDYLASKAYHQGYSEVVSVVSCAICQCRARHHLLDLQDPHRPPSLVGCRQCY